MACAREHAVSPAPRAQRIAGWLIQAVCRRLPADVRAERCREWTAELPAILDDQSIRPSFLRALRALSFCVGISWTARQLSRSARAASRPSRNAQWRTGALRARPPALAVRAVRGLLIWLVVVAAVLGLIALLRTRGLPPSLPVLLVLPLALGFDGFCLADIARAEHVRYLHKWVWVLICLAQAPLGGIMYLSIGHIGRDPSRRGG
jgi:Phospholipase_D-nuclease N-terminal